MDFFEAQDLARKRTMRLVLLFALAVLGVVASVYFLAMIFYSTGLTDSAGVAYVTGDYDNVKQLALSFWSPGVLLFALVSTSLVVGLGSLYKIAQLRDGGPAVALSLGGRKVDPDSTRLEERRLLNVVEEMAIASGVPVPEVYVLDRETGINAFAAGNTTSDAVIGVTQGTLQLLRRDELQGVIAHEFSHILNGDSRINLRAIGLLHGIFLLALIGRFLTRGSMRGGKKEGGGVALLGLGLLAIGSELDLAATGAPRRCFRGAVHARHRWPGGCAQEDRRCGTSFVPGHTPATAVRWALSHAPPARGAYPKARAPVGRGVHRGGPAGYRRGNEHPARRARHANECVC
jgi:Zn-dependent protease with chaperone function